MEEEGEASQLPAAPLGWGQSHPRETSPPPFQPASGSKGDARRVFQHGTLALQVVPVGGRLLFQRHVQSTARLGILR